VRLSSSWFKEVPQSSIFDDETKASDIPMEQTTKIAEMPDRNEFIFTIRCGECIRRPSQKNLPKKRLPRFLHHFYSATIIYIGHFLRCRDYHKVLLIQKTCYFVLAIF
jgi:hypothetical protein